MELTAYRVVQEALTNFLKHAGPEATALVTITYGMREIAIDVLDNGVATPAAVPQSPGHGLRGMHERVVALGGGFSIFARVDGGTTVKVTIPLPQDDTPEPRERTGVHP